MDEGDPTVARLEDQIVRSEPTAVQVAEGRAFIAAGTILVVAALQNADFGNVAWMVAGLGALVVILEGFQQLNQYQQNWINYRSTCEALKHEKFLHLANAGPYGDATGARTLLAERIEGLISQEHAKWTSAREEASRGSGGPSPAF